jgi:hypothetical protein
MSILDFNINEGYVAMVDGSLVYHRGFGERGATLLDASPSLSMSPRVFPAAGDFVGSRTYPLTAPPPPHGRPAPLQTDPANPGQYLAGKEYLASRWSPASSSRVRRRSSTSCGSVQRLFHGSGGAARTHDSCVGTRLAVLALIRAGRTARQHLGHAGGTLVEPQGLISAFRHPTADPAHAPRSTPHRRRRNSDGLRAALAAAQQGDRPGQAR